jgi:hypothetical protein
MYGNSAVPMPVNFSEESNSVSWHEYPVKYKRLNLLDCSHDPDVTVMNKRMITKEKTETLCSSFEDIKRSRDFVAQLH